MSACSVLSWVCFILILFSGFVAVELKFARDEIFHLRKILRENRRSIDVLREEL